VQDKEGLADPAELHLIGSWESVLDGLGAYADVGVTDFRLEVAALPRRPATPQAMAWPLIWVAKRPDPTELLASWRRDVCWS